MLEQATDALNRQDDKTGAKLVSTPLSSQSDDQMVQLRAAKQQEEHEELDKALESYRLLLKSAIGSKILTEARQGIERIEVIQKEIRAQAKASARAGVEDNLEPGFLILEPIELDRKQSTAVKFAEIMGIDPYSARLQLPSRGWRLYRTGTMGELKFYHQQLQQAEIPCFSVSRHDTQQIFVFKVNHFQSFRPQATIVCTDDRSEIRIFNFDWSEVTQMVTGLLPIFEEVVEIDLNNRTSRKPRILDYVHICDIQLHGRRSIFRLCSQTYEFSEYKQLVTHNRSQFFSSQFSTQLTGQLEGAAVSQKISSTSRDNWKNLIAQIESRCPDIKGWKDFTPFAETAMGHREMLGHINPHLELLRRADSLWDKAFHLYSTSSMLRGQSGVRDEGSVGAG
jgi:hypothetical protein